MTVVLLIGLTFGVTGALAVALPVGITAATIAVAVWAVIRLRAERAAHDDALTEWASTGAVLAERLQIARDLHDLVSHGLGMITVRAAAARHLDTAGANRADLVQALADIEAASREATVELRRMLGVLRNADEPAPREPTGSLESLPGIIEAATRTGLRVHLQSDNLGEVSPGVQLVIGSIVREALANTVRHAGPSQAQVRLGREGNLITVTITDAGAVPGWRAAPGAGHGLIGLRERIHALDGTIVTGPHALGYRVSARLPDGDTR
jgi:signal transduction histidine kinase